MMQFVWAVWAAVLAPALGLATTTESYPVPIPAGGRRDVHGWLILPTEQSRPVDPTTPLTAWFSHHVPEFWTDSPHNFQIILKGRLYPSESVEGELFVLDINYPPETDSLIYEFSFTPPSPFSLNDLLRGSLTKLNGVYYNGSFDTPYERDPKSLATLFVDELTTAVYLSEYETNSFKSLQYLSYPRGNATSSHFYLAHEIHAQPDFDHIGHGLISDCSSKEELTPG
jgi:hypothetical protein